jgi:hypothetical protein
MTQQETVDLTLVPVSTGTQVRLPEPVAGSSCSSTAAPAEHNAAS